MRILIAIPARYRSTRFPGKPLAKIAGKEMLQRVWDIAQAAARDGVTMSCAVGTEDERILAFCRDRRIRAFLTSEYCRTGTDRVLEIAEKITEQDGEAFDYVFNLQGDNPFCPPWFLTDMVNEIRHHPNIDIVTPCIRLDWSALDDLRSSKTKTPFTGTCVIADPRTGDAIWFSKQIIPAIRNEAQLRANETLSPVRRHIGLYGYRIDVLRRISDLTEGYYEALEGLEQLRFLENGFRIRLVHVDYRHRTGLSGIDDPTDITRAEAVIEREGELIQ